MIYYASIVIPYLIIGYCIIIGIRTFEKKHNQSTQPLTLDTVLLTLVLWPLLSVVGLGILIIYIIKNLTVVIEKVSDRLAGIKK